MGFMVYITTPLVSLLISAIPILPLKFSIFIALVYFLFIIHLWIMGLLLIIGRRSSIIHKWVTKKFVAIRIR